MPNVPSMEQRRTQLDARKPALAPELVALLMRLHELRLAAPTTLQAIATTAAELDSEKRKWRPSRVDEHLLAHGRPALPALAVRAALVELSCPPPSAGWQAKRRQDRARRDLAAELDALTVSAAEALGEETDGKLLSSMNNGPHPPAPKPWRRVVLAVSALAILGLVTVPVRPGVYAAHQRFEECVASRALSADPDRGPRQTLVQWGPLSAPPPNSTKYTVRSQTGALQATVVFTPSAQAARDVIEANKTFYGDHGIIGNDYTVGDTTVITPQVAGGSNAVRDCANGA